MLNTLNSVLYLAKHRHINLESVVLHVGMNDICKYRTEAVKDGFIKFAAAMLSLNVKLIISGPVPYPGEKSEYFSRLLNLNEWLRKWTEQNGLILVDNFDFFWQKHHLFSPAYGSFTLNDLGVMVLTHNLKVGYSSV